tara:strand:+ start:308 stop:463 length:156 start_codon:yes stop_codon:yes gene_type:complete
MNFPAAEADPALNAIASGVAEQYEKQVVPPEAREWPALLRMLDRMDPSYRE